MSFVACKYHPHEPARWNCEHCNIDFCGDCVKHDLRRDEANCPKCSKQLTQQSASNFIMPFWQRLPQFFKYPTAMGPLTFIFFLSLGLSVLPIGGIFHRLFTVTQGGAEYWCQTLVINPRRGVGCAVFPNRGQ